MAYVKTDRVKALMNGYRQMKEANIPVFQLERLNEQWRRASGEIPYYLRLKAESYLPDVFSSLAEYRDKMPPLTKTVVKENEISYKSPAPDHWRITGGSTAEPVQLPTWKSEYRENKLDIWLGRSWYGIEPADKLFLYWGHTHLLGTGMKGKIKGLQRKVKDYLQNYHRYSCFDLKEKALNEAGETIVRVKPDYIIGYAFPLDRLARANRSRAAAFKDIKIKAVIGASECFPFEDSAEVISEVFHAPVGMEYGSVETNLVGHTHPDGGYRVFWRSYLLEAADSGSPEQEVYVTSLFSRCTPLFRYRLYDLITVGPHCKKAGQVSLLSFDKVIGRSNKPVILPSKRELHSWMVSYVLKDLKKIKGYQLWCEPEAVRLRLMLYTDLNEDEISSIKEKAIRVDEEFARFLTIEKVDELVKSIAGKVPRVVYSPEL